MEQKQSEIEIASIITDLEGEIRGLSNSYRATVAIAVMKRLEAMKASIARGSRASVFSNMLLDRS